MTRPSQAAAAAAAASRARRRVIPFRFSQAPGHHVFSGLRIMATVSSQPRYGLNTNLSVDTPEPPVPLAKAWAASYPARASPFYTGHAHARLPLLNLAQGVPGHEPHTTLLRRMEIEREHAPMQTHGYGNVFGEDALRTALATDIRRAYGGDVSFKEVAITAGANLAAAVTFHALAKPGESIVLPTPWYFNHQSTLASLGINVIPLETHAPAFRPSPRAFGALLERHAGIKAIVLVTPNNPTGSIYPASLLEEFARVCAERQVALVLDETYREFLLDGDRETDGVEQATGEAELAQPHTLFSTPGFAWRNTVILLHSFSKSYAIPGHRLGAIIAHPALLSSETFDADGRPITRFGSLAKSLDNMQICPPRTDTQRAVATCVVDEEHREWRTEIANDLRARRTAFLSSLRDEQMTFMGMLEKLELQSAAAAIAESCNIGAVEASDLTSPSAQGWIALSAGSYYAYVRHPFPDVSSEVIARGLAALVGVVVLPGSFFRPADDASNDRDLRFSIANVPQSKLTTLGARLLLFSLFWRAHGVGWGL